MSDPIAYTYEADHHCPSCTQERFGRSQAGFIAEDAEDSEGNPVGVVFESDEWFEPTEPASVLVCADCGEELAEQVDTDAVEAIGREAGRAAATWVEFGGAEQAAAFWLGYEDGDPETMDACPSPLSGEWAGESLAELSREFGIPLQVDSVADAFESGYSDGWWTEALKAARDLLVGVAHFDRFDIAEAYSLWVDHYADASHPYWVRKTFQLTRCSFRPRPNLSLSTLTPNALGIYLGLVERTAA